MSRTAVADRRIEQLVAAFESATIDARDFDHEAHLLVCLLYTSDAADE